MPIRAFPCDSPAVRNLRFGIENFFPFLPHKFDTGRYIFLLYDCPLTRYIPYVSPNPDLIKLYVIKKKSESKDNIGKKALTRKDEYDSIYTMHLYPKTTFKEGDKGE
jgi:hypothetical protein